MALMEKLRAHSEKHFGPESKMNPVITRKILECYISDFALRELSLITSNKGKYIRQDFYTS